MCTYIKKINILFVEFTQQRFSSLHSLSLDCVGFIITIVFREHLKNVLQGVQ